MPGISRIKSKWQQDLGLNEWGQRVLVPGTMEDEIVETNQYFSQGSIDISKIKNLVVDSIVATTGTIGGFDIGADYVRDVANSFGLSSTVTGGDDIRFWAGDTYANRATAPLRISESGALVATSATISGSITATSGAIGGFDVGADYIRDVANSFGFASTVTGGDDVRFWAGDTFANRATAPVRITEAGALTATSATITGVINANTGYIGGATGWVISANTIADVAGVVGLSNAVTGGDDIRFWAGDIVPASAEFRVYESGALVASSATITGAITATSGTIGSFTIGTYLYTGTKTTYDDANAGVHLGSDGIGIGNNIFTVSSAGALVATSATITGVVTANTGYIGGVTGWVIATGKITSTGIGVATAAGDATYAFWAGDNTPASAEFSVSHAGALVASSATITGVVTANTGFIGGSTGWVIAAETIKDAAGTVGMSSTVTVGDDIRFWAGDVTPGSAEFRVYESGALVASSATITGSVTATSGAIGGWTINTTSITDAAGVVGMSSAVTGGDDIRFWAGDATPGSAEFYVTESGVLVASSATITGAVTANTGYIGGATGWVIATGKITSTGIGVATSAGDATYAFWAGDDTPASAEFRVSHAGALTATSATITGAITATSGDIGGWVVVSGYLYNLQSGTPTVAPNDGVVLASGNEGIIIYEDTEKRAEFGYLSAGVYGLKIYATNGSDVIFEASDTQQKVGGWNFTNTVLRSGASDAASNVLIDSANSLLRLGPTTGDYITLDGANKRIRSSDYVSGAAGAGFTLEPDLLEVGNMAARGIIRTAVFQKNVISAVGGSFAVVDSDKLNVDMTALDASTLTISGNTTFAVGDILRIKDGTDDEWLEVTNIASAPTYTVTRDKAAAYAADTNPVWKNGATVVNYGASGEGLVYMTASDTNAPYLQVSTHAGSPWSTLTTRTRLGNLNGYLGYVADIYGLGVGSSSAGEANITIEPTNGLRIRSGTTTIFQVDMSGGATLSGWTIDADEIKDTAGVVGMSSAVTGGDDIRFWAGDVTPGSAEFRVYESGALVASSATITGAITATSGAIGGWVVGADYIRDAAGVVGMSSAVTGGDDIRFWAGDATMSSAEFRVTEAGALTATSATITGVITANTGFIGGTTGWVISSENIKDAAGVVGLSSTVTVGDDIRIWAGNATPGSAPFYVTEAGALVATSATITGAITANSGYIGGTTGWVITSENIKDASGTVGMSATVTVGDDVRFWAGDATPTSAEFRVYESGALVATSATITGAITATSGAIGGWVVTAADIKDAAGVVGMSSAVTGGDDIRFWAGDATPGSAEFRVYESGALVASSATITGAITATSGAIGGFIVGTDYVRDAADSFGMASTVTGGDDIRFWAGDTFANRATAPFRVTEAGVMTATSGTFSGTLSIGSIPGLPTDDLLFGHWGMDEGSGLTIVDLSGNARTGTGVGTTYAQGIVNQGLSFNGTDYVSIAGAASLPTAAITVSVWVKATAPGDSYRIFWHAWAAAGDWILYSDATNWIWGVRDGTNTQQLVASAHGGSTTWHHLVGTYDGSTSRFYVDGVEVGTALAFAVALNTGGTFRLSHDAFNTFQGTMDEAAIYTSALSANQVKALYTNPSGNSNSGIITAKLGLIGGWAINATSIYTGTEDHSGYTANAGDLTIYSDGADASIHAKNFYIDSAGVLNCASAVFNGAVDGTSTVNGSTATNVQYRSEAFFAEDMVYIGRHNDGLTEATTNSTITRQPLCTLIANGGGATDQGRVISSFLGTSIDNGVIDWDEKDWEFYCNCETSATTNQDAFWGLFDRSTAVPAVDATDTTRHIGFYVQDGTIYASNANGTTQTKTDVSSGITLTNDNYYRFVYDVGVNIKFYINDVLVATHTTNMPTANTNDDPAILFWIANTAAEVKKLQFKNNYIVIARS